MVFRIAVKKYFGYLMPFMCVFGFFPINDSTAEISPLQYMDKLKERSCLSDACTESQLLLVFKRNRSERLLHGKGRRGSGFCPQARSTPSAPDEFLKMKNPLEINRDNREKGKALFQYGAQPTACKVCHGSLGNGMGIMPGLNPKPRNFACKETMSKVSDGQIFYIITHGSQGTEMPAFRFLSDDQVWQIIIYLRSLSK
jgi:hypothetical protein